MAKAQRLFISLAVVAVIGGGVVWYLTSPLYAVKNAADAVHDHNVQRFHEYVDVHEVARNAMEDLLAEPIRKSGAGILERVIGVTLVSIFEPPSADAMEHQIDHWVEHKGKSSGDSEDGSDDQPRSIVGQLVALVKPPSLKQVFEDYGLTRKNYRGFHQTQAADDDAHVLLDFNSPKTNGQVSVDLELHKEDGKWKITRIANLQDLVARLPGP